MRNPALARRKACSSPITSASPRAARFGAAAFVHYGVIMGERAVLDADSFLMKGEVLDPHSCWRGNPAKLYRRNTPHELSVERVAASERAAAPEPLESFVACVAAE